jgi:hypothetical protein
LSLSVEVLEGCVDCLDSNSVIAVEGSKRVSPLEVVEEVFMSVAWVSWWRRLLGYLLESRNILRIILLSQAEICLVRFGWIEA